MTVFSVRHGTNVARLGRSAARPVACKPPACCRLPSPTWEFGFPCHSPNRRVSYVVVVSDSGQRPGSRLRRPWTTASPACEHHRLARHVVHVWSVADETSLDHLRVTGPALMQPHPRVNYGSVGAMRR